MQTQPLINRLTEQPTNRPTNRQITLEELKTHKGGALSEMALFKQSRLSVQPVAAAEWEFILGLEGEGGEGGGGGGKKGNK